MEVSQVTGGSVVSKEESSSVQSSSSEEKKVVGGVKVVESVSSFQSEQSSTVVQQSSSVVSSSSRVVQSSSERLLSSQEQVLAIDKNGNCVDAEGGVSTETVAPSTAEPADDNNNNETEETNVTTDGSSESRSTEIKQENIKSTLREIISEIEQAVVPEVIQDSQTDTATGSTETPTSTGNAEARTTAKRTLDKQTSTTTLEENLQEKESRPVSLTLSPAEMMRLLQSVQIARELNDEVKRGAEEMKENNAPINDVPTRPIDLEKLFTPAPDSGEVTPSRARKMYASSSFYSPTLHPTVEDQVELARRISQSLSDISNQRSKGQSMYVNRKKRSVKWVHEEMRSVVGVPDFQSKRIVQNIYAV